ncbi:UNVERIFIED_CONTAM: hypothetical protein PYX00_005594 [Menopon gallinae]|uniref:Apoptosis-inducing factor 1, mitochondrial n=1 Tax=Menopon gallinae TaxID=328185 RepID=A0AAW2HTR6_9NEOP
MIRHGTSYRLIRRCFIPSDLWIVRNTQRPFLLQRFYACDEGAGKGKSGKGSTARVEECIPHVGTPKKIPAANMRKCPPPPKIKIPSTAPVKTPKVYCPCPRPGDICDQQPQYPECRLGGHRNPVVQNCRKPNMMEDCCRICPCPEDPAESKKKFRRHLWLALLMLALFAFTMYKLMKKEEEEVVQEVALVPRKQRRKRLPCKEPKNSYDIPNSVPYLLIGGGAAAFSAFRSIKTLDPKAQVLVITNESEFPYMRPPLSKEMWFHDDPELLEKLKYKQWNGKVSSVFFEPESFYKETKDLLSSSKGGVAVARGWKVVKVDPYNRKAILEDGYSITYGKCLIATGSIPKTLPVFDRAGPGVANMIQTFRDVFDFQDLHDMAEEYDTIAIIGGGFLGSELACALARYGRKRKTRIIQIFKESGNMGKILPEYLSLWTKKKVEAEGVEVISNSRVTDAFAQDGKLNLVLSTGQRILVDHCVVAVGARPNTDMAETSGLETHKKLGGYLVNAELEARSHLYIAGDAACFYDMKLGRRRIEHHDHAVVSGKLAGENMVGAAKPYHHQSMFWSDLGPEVGYEAIGIVDSKLPTVGVFAKKTEKDSPEAVVKATGDNIRSQTEAKAAPIPPAKGSPKPPQPGEDFGKGVIFYLRDDIVVGIVTWNVFSRMQIARQVLKEEKKYEDLNEVAKLFNIHDE